MVEIGYSLTLPNSETDKLVAFAATFSEKVQKRVFNFAGRKAAQALASRVESLVPIGSKPHGFTESAPGHLRGTVAFKQKSYRASGTTVFIVGYRSKQNPLATLLEKGNFLTSPRMTRHESNSGRVRVPIRMIRRKKTITRADGSKRTTWVMAQKTARRSTGSRALTSPESQGPRFRGRFMKGGGAHSTGDFPKSKIPYAPIGNAYRTMRETCQQILLSETKSAFDRAFAKR